MEGACTTEYTSSLVRSPLDKVRAAIRYVGRIARRNWRDAAITFRVCFPMESVTLQRSPTRDAAYCSMRAHAKSVLKEYFPMLICQVLLKSPTRLVTFRMRSLSTNNQLARVDENSQVNVPRSSKFHLDAASH